MKNNLLKRIAAAALAAATVLTCAPTTAMAAAPDTGSVTITKYDGDNQGYEEYGGEQTVQPGNNLLSHVKFAYAEVGERVQINTGDTYEMMYTLKDGVASVLGSPDADHTDNGVDYYRQETLQTALRQKKDDAIEYVKGNKGNTEQETAESTGQVKFKNLALDKLYLFAETDATGAKNAATGDKVNVTRISAPFLVSLPFTGKDGNQLYDLKVYPKNATGQETIDKKIVEDGKEVTETQANIGDKINYKVTYSVPVSEYGLTKLVVTDTMGKGLTFDNSVEIKNGDKVVDNANNQNYEVSAPVVSGKGTTITITFTEAYLNSLKKSSTQSFTITYGATVNNDAVLGQTGNKNEVYVTYQNKGDTEHNTDHKETKVFTYGINLLKKGENDANLSNVEFTLTKGTDAVSAAPVKVKEVTASNQKTFYVTDNNAGSNTVKTNAEGKVYIRGLEAGTYFLTETKTNAGYVLLKNPVKIVIEQTDSKTGAASATVDGKNTTMNEDSLNQGSATAEVPLTVVNHKGFDLPATGGAGTALFTIAGIVIVAVAAALLFMRKKSQK